MPSQLDSHDIIERKKAEEELAKAASFPTLNPNPILEVDFEGRVTYLNPIAKSTFINIQELGLAHPLLSNWEEVVKSLKIKTSETLNREIFFEDKWYNELMYIVQHEKTIRIYLGDVTERKKAEEALKKSQQTFFELVERAPFGIYIVDSEFRISHMNIGSQNGAFKNVRPVIGRPFSEAMHILWPDKVAEEIISHFRHTLETGEPYYSPRFTNPRHDVEIVESYEWELHRIMLPDNKFGVICYYFDSTRIRAVEEALRKSEVQARQRAEELQKLMNIIPAAIWISNDPECKVIVGNQTANHFYEAIEGENVSAGPATGTDKNTTRRFYQNGRELSPQELPMQEAAANNREINNSELEVLAPSGKKMTMVGSAKPLLTEEGKVRGCLSAFIDITERKKAEEALVKRTEQLQVTQKKLENQATLLEEYANQMEHLAEQRTKQLQDAERMAAIGQTAGMVGHDIRNPLQAITGDLYLIEEELRSPNIDKKAICESVDSINENISYINKIVSDLQDYTRPIKPNPVEIDLKDKINGVLMSANIPKTIETHLDITEGLRINFDKAYLRRILQNLIINAVQAMPSGGRLTVSAHPVHGRIRICVQDTGVGIPEDIKPNLFKPLYTTKSKGQGLGLAVVKRLVEGMNGTISFESKEGQGTVFTIELPLQ